MKKGILTVACATLAAFAISSCSDWVKPEPLYTPEENIHGEDYYKALREYKASDHVKSFGWFSSWTALGTDMKNYLIGLPDSMDIVSHWYPVESYAEPLSAAQKKDLAAMEKRGTKVLFCLFFKDIGFRMTPGVETAQNASPSEEYKTLMRNTWGWYERNYDGSAEADAAIQKYARALKDYVIENNYAGIDFDYEVNYGERGNLVESTKALHVLLTELSKYMGPKSNSGLILAVDGEPQTLAAESGPLIDYYIIQAYSCSGDSNLDSRFSGLYNKFSSVEDEATVLRKLIWTEDFEKWQDGKLNFTFRSGHKNPGLDKDGNPRTSTPYSIDGMARYYRDINGQTVKIGGFGAYRFELKGAVDEYNLFRRLIRGEAIN